MIKRFVLVLALVALTGVRASAADSVLQQIADALDVSTTKTFQCTSTGVMFEVGQSRTPVAPFPRFYLKSLSRTYDLTAGAMRDEMVRTQGENPPSGGGVQPIDGEQRVVSVVSGEIAWNEAGKDMVPRYWEANNRAHQLVTSPHGLVRAAFANNAAVTKQTIQGREMFVIAFTDRGKH